MKLSARTLNILKNYSDINSQLLMKSGSLLKTVSAQKTILAQSKVTEVFPNFAIYDLKQFLSAYSLFSDPDMIFGEKQVLINGANGTVLNYTYAAPENMITPPAKEIKLPSIDAVLKVTREALNAVLRAAGVLSLSEIMVVCDKTKCYLTTGDTKNSSSNTFKYPLEDSTSSEAFTAVFKIENLKIIQQNYKVSLSSKGISHFVSEDDMEYWIALETSSNMGA